MKFSTRCESDLPVADLFDQICDFEGLEHLLLRRGAVPKRLDPHQQPGVGAGWDISFNWRGRLRELRLVVDRFERPERLVLSGQSDSFDIGIDITFVGLSRTRSRLLFEVDIRPRTMRARLMLQTAKLGKSQLDRKFDQRIRSFVNELRVA